MIKIYNTICYGNYVYIEGKKCYIGEIDEWWYGKEVEVHAEVKKFLGITRVKPILAKLKEVR